MSLPRVDDRSDGIPPVNTNFQSGKHSVGNSSKQQQQQLQTELPSIGKSSMPSNASFNYAHTRPVAYDEKAIVKETKYVVGTATSGKESLPEAWTQQRINTNSDSPNLQMTKSEWENQIARHILSVFATTNAIKNLSDSKRLLDFVDDRNMSKHSENESNKNDSGANPSNSDGNIDKGTMSKKKKKKKVLKKNSFIVSEDSVGGESTEECNRKFMEKLLARVDVNEVEKETKDESKYRINQVIKGRHGTEIVIRGAPKCFPVWFVSTGEVYADWTGLPGGHKLQAHLDSLYEKRMFEEYLGVIEMLLLDQYKDRMYGVSLNSTADKFGKEPLKPRVDSRASSRGSNRSGSAKRSSSRGKSPVPNSTGKSSSQIDKASLPSSILRIESAETKDNNFWRNHIRTTTSKSREEPIVELSLEEIALFWAQLVKAIIAMGILAVEKKNYDLAMDYFNRAERYTTRDDILYIARLRKELRASTHDAMAYFFFKRRKSLAALSYTTSALEAFEEADGTSSDNIDGIAICLLHIAAIFNQLGRFKDAHMVTSINSILLFCSASMLS